LIAQNVWKTEQASDQGLRPSRQRRLTHSRFKRARILRRVKLTNEHARVAVAAPVPLIVPVANLVMVLLPLSVRLPPLRKKIGETMFQVCK